MSMKELLSDGRNGVNDAGDVVPVDEVVWQPKEAFEPDHYRDDVSDEPVDATDHLSRGGLLIQLPEHQHGPSVRLVDRAIAIEAIMGYFNQANKRIGLSKSRGYNEFDARYGRGADEVAANMNAKESRLYAEFMRSVGTLLARDGMIAAGFPVQEVDANGKQLVRDLYHDYGPGNADAGKRAKLVRKANKTVRIVVDGKKR